mgnify:CR=1 FL=1
MDLRLRDRIGVHLGRAGYGARQICVGIAYADTVGYSDDDDALGLVLANILYDAIDLAKGAVVAVEAGSW